MARHARQILCAERPSLSDRGQVVDASQFSWVPQARHNWVPQMTFNVRSVEDLSVIHFRFVFRFGVARSRLAATRRAAPKAARAHAINSSRTMASISPSQNTPVRWI